MRRRWIGLLGAALLAIVALGDLARAIGSIDAGPEIRAALDDPPVAVLVASASRATPAIEPPSRDARTFLRLPRSSLTVVRDAYRDAERTARAAPPRFRPLRFAPRGDASADPH